MRRSDGSILILVLFALAVLSLLSVSMAYRASLRTRAARSRIVMVQLRAQVESAVAIALNRLGHNTNDFDHPAEAWRAHRALWEEEWLPSWRLDGAGAPSEFEVDYVVTDEASKLNVLYASSESLERLGMTGAQVAGLLDWMDADAIPRAQGAESDYYQSLPRPYHGKDGIIEIMDELALVHGFQSGDLVRDEAPGPQPSAEATIGRPTAAPEDMLTCFGDGRLNLNTALRRVLKTLPLSDGAVDQIIAYRAFDEDSSDSLDDHVFHSAADVSQLQGLTGADVAVLANIGVYQSEWFTIHAWARHRPTGLTCQARVRTRIEAGKVDVLQWQMLY